MAIKIIVAILSDFFQVEETEISAVLHPVQNSSIQHTPAIVLSYKKETFFVEYKGSGKIASVDAGITRLKMVELSNKKSIRLLVVPYMYETGKKHCTQAKISWLDLSGNADITGPGIRILISDKPDKYKKPGRSAGVFAWKSSRIARVLLTSAKSAFTQRELATITDLDEGYVSKIVKNLERNNLINRIEGGSIKAADKNLLLQSWQEEYDFQKHVIHRGHIPARSGISLLKETGRFLENCGVEYAATGLAGAWEYTHFADYRMVSIYIKEPLSNEVLSQLNFTKGEKGENCWLIEPKDDWVFYQSRYIKGTCCVHPLQVYLDLKGHPERAEEASAEIRQQIFRPAP